MSAEDPFELSRFIEAQEGVVETAFAELRAGRKRSHWMWFVFPQLEGLGFSAMSRRYAIGSLDEARAYLAHPLLGPRLREGVAAAMDGAQGDGPDAVRRLFGQPDDAKLRSCLTLFREAAEEEARGPFDAALARFYGGESDPATLELLVRG